MWSDIIHEFGDSPSQSRVVRFLLENGFGVTDDGRISCNGIEMPATAVAKATGEGHIKSLEAKKMGMSTSEVGDLLSRFISKG